MNLLFLGLGNTGISIADRLSKNNNIFYYDVVKKNVAYKYLPLTKLKKSNFDYIIVTLSSISILNRLKLCSKYNTTYDLRKYELVKNKNSLKKIINYLPNSKVIVVSNPVDDIVTFLSKNTNLDVIGFGISLDALRYSNYFKQKINCIGLHGFSVPLKVLKNKTHFLKSYSAVDLKLFNSFKVNGINYDLVSKEFELFFNKLNSDKQNTLYLSKYISKDILGLENISLSLPYFVKKGKVVGLKQIKLTSLEKNLLK